MLKKLAHIGARMAIGAIVAAFAAQSSLHSASAASKAAAINDAERILGFQVTMPAKRLIDVRFTDAEGALVTLKDKRGTVVLINFWATWCPPCVHEMPSLERLQTELGGDGFEVLAINEDREARVIGPFYDHFGLTQLRGYHDPYGRLSRQLKVTGLPTTILIDHRGNEVGRVVGAAEWDSPASIALMRYYLAQPISAASAE
jgi:thiol-disulfide isomerase/thioredoxin